MFSIIVATAHAANVEYDAIDNTVYVSGRITSGDAKKVWNIIDKIATPDRMIMNSNGGVFIEGIELGLIVRHFDMEFYAAKNCHSSCAYAALAANRLFIVEGTAMTLHLPYFEHQETDFDAQLNAVLRYFDAIDLPKKVRRRFVKLADTDNNKTFPFALLLGK